MHLLEGCAQGLEAAGDVVFDADGDAHVAVAAGVGGAVAEQDALVAHAADELLVARADFEEDEVGVAGPEANVHLGEGLLDAIAAGVDLGDVPVQIGGSASAAGSTARATPLTL